MNWIYIIGAIAIVSGVIGSARSVARQRRQQDAAISVQMAIRQQQFQREFQQRSAQQAGSSPMLNDPRFSDEDHERPLRAGRSAMGNSLGSDFCPLCGRHDCRHRGHGRA